MAEDFALLDAWCDGDRRAGDALVRTHFAAVHRFFRNKAWDDAEDLAQTTLLRCVVMRDRFERRSSFRTFLFSVARHVLFEHYRRKAGTQAFDPIDSAVADVDPSPSQIVSEFEWQRAFLTALRQIPAESQMVLELYYWEGMGTQEIAEVVGVPRGTVKSRLHQARKRLAERCRAASVDLTKTIQMPGWARDLEPETA
ncbi:MAG: sigma-70 family RNA polymerase sigma factor [Myxococcota bacterium]